MTHQFQTYNDPDYCSKCGRLESTHEIPPATTLYITSSIVRVSYSCPHCDEYIGYETDSLPVKEECHKCLQPLKFIHQVISKI